MKTITDYSREFDIEVSPLLEFEFDERIRALVADRFEFDPEESYIAPEPSIACRVRSETDIDFVPVYLNYSRKLIVFVQNGVDQESAKRDFLEEVPELLPYLSELRKW